MGQSVGRFETSHALYDGCKEPSVPLVACRMMLVSFQRGLQSPVLVHCNPISE